MAYKGPTSWYVKPGVDVNVPGATAAQVAAGYGKLESNDSSGIILVDEVTYSTADDHLPGLGAVRVDYEGEDEAITDGTVQTFTILNAFYVVNDSAETILNIYDTSAAGTLLFGPITLEASKERIIVFPTPLVSVGGIFFSTPTGALASGAMIGA
jgi:hypothetical protein